MRVKNELPRTLKHHMYTRRNHAKKPLDEQEAMTPLMQANANVVLWRLTDAGWIDRTRQYSISMERGISCTGFASPMLLAGTGYSDSLTDRPSTISFPSNRYHLTKNIAFGVVYLEHWVLRVNTRRLVPPNHFVNHHHQPRWHTLNQYPGLWVS